MPNEYREHDRRADDLLVDAVKSHAIFSLDAAHEIATWPESAQSVYGYDPVDVLGESVLVLLSETATWDEPPADLLAPARDRVTAVDDWHQRADGSVFWGKLTMTPVWRDEFRGFAVVSEDVTDDHQAMQLLERQNDRLKEFTDILVHDLRNPINVIISRVELARQDDEYPDHLDIIEATAYRMDRLVDDLLRVARQGNPVRDPTPIDIDAVIETAWEGTGDTDSNARLLYDDVGAVAGDEVRLCQLFENLFRNSLEHGNPAVTVRVGPLDGGFYVEDDGPGIPETDRKTVFDHGYTTSSDGSGYGLSVVRTIAGAHGWDTAVSDGIAGGARFEFTGVEFLD